MQLFDEIPEYNKHSFNLAGIYVITFIKGSTYRYYIGSAEKFSKRIATHKTPLLAGTHFNPYMQRTFNKYGKEYFYFDILRIVDCSIENLKQVEQDILNYYRMRGKDVFNSQFDIVKCSSVSIKDYPINIEGKKPFSKICPTLINIITRHEIEGGNSYSKTASLIGSYSSNITALLKGKQVTCKDYVIKSEYFDKDNKQIKDFPLPVRKRQGMTYTFRSKNSKTARESKTLYKLQSKPTPALIHVITKHVIPTCDKQAELMLLLNISNPSHVSSFLRRESKSLKGYIRLSDYIVMSEKQLNKIIHWYSVKNLNGVK